MVEIGRNSVMVEIGRKFVNLYDKRKRLLKLDSNRWKSHKVVPPKTFFPTRRFQNHKTNRMNYIRLIPTFLHQMKLKSHWDSKFPLVHGKFKQERVGGKNAICPKEHKWHRLFAPCSLCSLSRLVSTQNIEKWLSGKKSSTLQSGVR